MPDTLKVSDYFDHASAFILTNTRGLWDFKEFPDKYLTLLHVPLSNSKFEYKFYLFDKEGHFHHQIGEIGRGAGEYLSILNGLQVGKDTTIRVLDFNKYLVYSMDGILKHEEKLGVITTSGVPYLWRDSLIFFNKLQALGSYQKIRKSERKQRKKEHKIEVYSLTEQRITDAYFPMREFADLVDNNHIFDYNDTLCFYHDKDQRIYQIAPEPGKIRYQIDKGRYDRLQTIEEYLEALKKDVSYARIDLYSCNETDKYVLGTYYFKRNFYIYIYDKKKGITKNFRWVDNDLLGTGTRKGMFYMDWVSELRFKQDYLWLTSPSFFADIMDQVKSDLTEEQWEAYCKEHLDFIYIYEKLKKDLASDLDEDNQQHTVVLKFYFK